MRPFWRSDCVCRSWIGPGNIGKDGVAIATDGGAAYIIVEPRFIKRLDWLTDPWTVQFCTSLTWHPSELAALSDTRWRRIRLFQASRHIWQQGVEGPIPSSSTKKNRCGCTGSSLFLARCDWRLHTRWQRITPPRAREMASITQKTSTGSKAASGRCHSR